MFKPNMKDSMNDLGFDYLLFGVILVTPTIKKRNENHNFSPYNNLYDCFPEFL